MTTIIDRLYTSGDVAKANLTAREQAGTQPWLPATDSTFLWTANLFYLTTIVFLYIIVCGRGRVFYKEQLRNVLIVYNAMCIAMAGYVVVGILHVMWEHPSYIQFMCNPSARDDVVGQRLAHYFLVFYLQKFFEYADTWFFVLRGSIRQVSFLHVYHHVSVTVVIGTILPFEFSGDMFLPILCNSVVHVLMYGHYLASALGAKCWWRKYLTMLQLMQFILITIQSGYSWSACPTSGAPDFVKLMMCCYMGTMLLLFLQFFIRRYQSKNVSVVHVHKEKET